MTLRPESLVSERVEVEGGLSDAVEMCYQKGWTDGLPVVPPTEEKVIQFLELAGRNPSDVIGVEPVRGRVITAEKVAINAVMAGCLPEYMPVLFAVAEAIVQPEYNLHGSSASTGGSAPLLLINGPIVHKLKFATGHNIFGPGPDRRANATVGRGVRLMLINTLENHPGVLDRSTLGHPGKYSYCIAEDEENSPWEPLHVERGFSKETSTVTVFTCSGPWQLGAVWDGTPEAVLTAAGDTMLGLNPGQSEVLLIMSREHQGFFKDAGWSKTQVKEFLYQKASRTAKEWAAAQKVGPPEPGKESEPIHVLQSPEGLVLIAGGGSGGPWDAIIPRWGRGANSRSITREIDTSRIP